MPTTFTPAFINGLMGFGEPRFHVLSAYYQNLLRHRDFERVDLAVAPELLRLADTLPDTTWHRAVLRDHLLAAHNPMIPRYRRVMHLDRAGAIAWDFAQALGGAVGVFDLALFMKLFADAGGV